MLNKFTIGICVGGGVGLAVGAFATYLYLKRKFEQEFSQKVEKELEESRRVYRSAVEKPGLTEKVTENLIDGLGYSTENGEVLDEIGEKRPAESVLPVIPGTVIGRIDYTKPNSSEENDKKMTDIAENDVDFDDEIDEAEGLYPRDDIITSPYMISSNEFMSDRRYEKATCFYYEDDDMLVTEDDEILEPIKAVGMDIDEYFGKELPGRAYVRNELLGYDYEVILKRQAYYSEY